MQDSKSNRKSVFATLGASDHSDGERAYRDLYCTHPSAVESLLKVETFSRYIWEPAAGLLHISKTLEEHGHYVRSSDIEARCEGVEEKDFLFMDCEQWCGDIITNPPYSTAGEFVLKALHSVGNGAKVAMLLRLLFLEGQQRRREIFENAPPPYGICLQQAHSMRQKRRFQRTRGGGSVLRVVRVDQGLERRYAREMDRGRR